jgi:hypothetical protein
MTEKYDFFDKFSYISQLIGIIILGFVAYLDKDIRPVVIGFVIGWLLALRGKR